MNDRGNPAGRFRLLGRLTACGVWYALALVLIPLICGVVFLAGNAPRDWSLHWVAPVTVVAAASSGPYDAVSTPVGWDVLWTNGAGQMRLSRFQQDGRRAAPDVSLAGTPVSLTLGRVGTTDVAVWREDLNNGQSVLRAALLSPGHPPRYRTLARGPWPLEQPHAFRAGSRVDVVFSWQRPVFDVYLAGVTADGAVMSPVRLTHAVSYAFYPHAVEDGGAIQLLYLDQCCGGDGYDLVASRYTLDGRRQGRAQRLDRILSLSSGNGGQGSSPNSWGLDVQHSAGDTWVAWSSDQGIAVARLHGGRLMTRNLVMAVAPPSLLALAVAGKEREVIWPQPSDLGTNLSTVQLDAAGLSVSAPDRVSFEPASDDVPRPIVAQGRPAVLWQASPNTSVTRLEVSHFTPATIGPPNLWTRFGLGLANPLGNIVLLILGGAAFGLLIAAVNVLLVLALAVVYILAFRLVSPRWRPVLFAALLAVALFIILVALHAPFPPVLILSQLSPRLGGVAVAGMALFVYLISRSLLRRFDETYRAGVMAFLALYFLAFLQALTVIQGQLGRI